MTLHIIVLVSLKGSVVYAAVKSLINLGLSQPFTYKHMNKPKFTRSKVSKS